MPRTRSLAWSELKIGVLAVIALVLAAVITFLVGGQGGFFWQRYHLKTRFADVQGLKSGAVVRVAGVEVGKVTAIQFSGAEVEVLMEVGDAMRSHITDRSRASIGSVSLLGEPVVDITPSEAGTPLGDWGYVLASQNPRQLADVAERASLSLDEATRLLRDVREGKGTVGRLFTDDTLYRQMKDLVEAAEKVTTGLARGEGTVGQLMRNPEAYREIVAALGNLEDVTKRVASGEGSLGMLLKDDALAKSLTSATRSLSAVGDKINEGDGTMGKLVNDPALYDRLNTLAARLEQVANRLDAGEGTVGQLLRDKQLYENMNGAATELRALVGDIRKDPKKYLNVKVSIF
jgi:phospholipid/cholesterol/gamma-HCH transport system substrate-binding protein